MNIRNIFYLSAFSLIFSGCTKHSFLPHTQNVPVFTDKHQVEVNALYSASTYDFQIAYSPVKHFSAMANMLTTTGYILPEIGFGGYIPYRKFNFAAYVGYAQPSYSDSIYKGRKDFFFNYSGHDIYVFKLQAERYFIQPQITFSPNNYFNITLSLKNCFWKYNQLYSHYERWERVDFHRVELQDSTTFRGDKNMYQLSYEPAITIRAGGKNFKCFTQVGFTLCSLTNTRQVYSPYQNSAFVRVGFNANIDVLGIVNRHRH